MKRIEKADYEKRIERIASIFTDIAQHADVQSKTRCPYKDKMDQCTAKFGCKNKRKPRELGQLPHCASDDRLDYRTAWESDPQAYVELGRTIKATADKNRNHRDPPTMGSISHDNQSLPLQVGKTIFDYADELAVRVPTSCGRTGHCHECVIEIKRGMKALSDRTEAENFLSGHYRLACQSTVENEQVDIAFALIRRTPRILTSTKKAKLQLKPAVTRRGNAVYYLDEQIDQYRGRIYGLAIDLGTTTVVADLIDLETGESLYEITFENPQRFGGSDIMYRISYDLGQNQGELHTAIINTLNNELRDMCRQLNLDRHVIYEIVVVGNSTMRELFFNHDVQAIGQKPYKSDIEQQYLAGKRNSTVLTTLARKLRLRSNKNARIYSPPLVASHVGADTAACLVDIDIASQSDIVMLVDAGTNTEVVIGNKDRIVAASCPAGPAFEGGLVTCGMSGCNGAIESIQYDNGRFNYKTISNAEPIGICGSGLIDLLAELSRHDLMTPKGVFADKAKLFTIAAEYGIILSREDASHLAQAKAANFCGQTILMRTYGISPDQISKLYLAGGFANYVDVQSAIDIGFLAPVPPDRIVKIGNAAAEGARQLLLSKTKRTAIDKLVKTIEHVELETTADFFDLFVEGCQFKPMPQGRA